MSISKKYSKSQPAICKVAFKLDGEEAAKAKSVSLAGDFNNWSIDATPMKKNTNSFECSMDLATGHQYRFRYVIDGQIWCNDPQADCFEYSGIGDSTNSVISV